MGLARAARPARRLGVGHDGASAGRGACRTRAGGAGSCAEPRHSRIWSHGLDAVVRKLGGLTQVLAVRPDGHRRLTDTGRITAGFAGVAKHYGVQVALCPPRRGNRKGVVEKANHTAAQRFWRTLADDVTVEQAQAGAR